MSLRQGSSARVGVAGAARSNVGSYHRTRGTRLTGALPAAGGIRGGYAADRGACVGLWRRVRARLANQDLPDPADRGSALVDFLLVSVLVTALMLGVVQLALTLHVRTILTDSAASGARYAALSGHSLSDGRARTSALISSSLPAAYAQEVSVAYGQYQGVEVVEVEVSAPMPVLGLFGPSGVIRVTGRALEEGT